MIRVSELTSMEIQPPAKPGEKQQLDLRSGATYFFSREKPSEVQFRTPVASGAIRGTEFNLAVAEDGHTTVALLDGAVDLNNAQGAIVLAKGEEGHVEAGSAPRKTALLNGINVIQWALYYPAVIDPDELGLTESDQNAYKDSLAAYRQGDLLAALSALPESASGASASVHTLRGALLLAAGKVEQTETELRDVQAGSPFATALRELIAAVKHQKIEPLTTPGTGSEWMARSYYMQSRGNLQAALDAARQASVKSPRFGFAWVRVAELEFGFGHVDQATAALNRGLELSPRNAEGLALRGFLFSAKNQFAEAARSFDEAISVDGALANAWLGRGLVKIRKGHHSEGLADLHTAATLEPQRSILRSYLGKGWTDNYDFAHARKELGMARELDPNDPTSWLYMALLDQQDNRINQAIEDLEKSKELNENRSVFRSRLLLDQDQAVRGANLASMYRDAGMFDRSVQEASRAVNLDYANSSAHLFLANSYDALRDPKLINLRYETPWFSELLVANLLMPVNGANLSQNISQQEYSKLFSTDGLGVFSSTEYTSQGDWIQSGSQYGVFGNSSYSLDAYYRTEVGQRPNNDLEQLSLAARFKQQLTEKDSIFLQVGYFNAESGDVAQYFYQTNASTTFRAKETQEPNLLAGYHREWGPGSHTLFLFSRFDDTLKLSDSNSHPLTRTTFTFLDMGGNLVTNDFVSTLDRTSLRYESQLEAYSGELQQIFQTACQTLIVGGRYQAGWADTTTRLLRPADPNNPFSVAVDVPQQVDSDMDRLSLYAYEHWQVFDTLRLIGGVSYDRLHFPENIDTSPITSAEETKDRVSPKAGVLWSPLKDTHLRAAYSQSLGGVFFDQSVRLEPVQLAGFNSAFRSLVPESVAGLAPGTRFETWGLGLDQRIEPTRTYFLVQGEFLNSDVTRTIGMLTNDVSGGAPLTPTMPGSARQSLDFEERSVIVSVNQLLWDDWALGVRYKLTDADLDMGSSVPTSVTGASALSQDVSATLHQVYLYAIYQHPCGFFGQFDTVWSEQSNHGYSPSLPGDDFWQFNVYAGYRFFQRRAEVRLGVVNLTDRDYKLNPLTLYNELPRERMFTAALKFNF
jgi:Tfp pilus assembly protein PilF